MHHLTVVCSCLMLICFVFFFFKQKTAYEMRISDWSSDVCSSDLILIVVNDERLTDFECWSAAEDRLTREVEINQSLGAPVSFIVHTLTDVNAKLERGLPFFVDIADRGIALYEADGFPFAQPRKLPAAEARAAAQKHFDVWFPRIGAAVRGAAHYIEDGQPLDAAFTLHQAVERA